MIPFNDYKKLLGDCASEMTDDEIRLIRKEQYRLADIALDAWFDSCANNLKDNK